MGDLGRSSDADLDRILSRPESVPNEDQDLGAFLGELRSAYVAPPSEATTARHLNAMLEVHARESKVASERTAPRGGRRRRPFVGRKRTALAVAALALALPFGTAGLAAAGVALPAALQDPFERLGIELPNQSSALDVRAVIDSTPPDERDCSFGARVAKAASGGKSRAVTSCERTQSAGRERDRRSRAAVESSPKGAPPPPGQPGGVNAGQAFGDRTAAEARQSARAEQQAFGERVSEHATEHGSPRSAAPAEPSAEEPSRRSASSQDPPRRAGSSQDSSSTGRSADAPTKPPARYDAQSQERDPFVDEAAEPPGP